MGTRKWIWTSCPQRLIGRHPVTLATGAVARPVRLHTATHSDECPKRFPQMLQHGVREDCIKVLRCEWQLVNCTHLKVRSRQTSLDRASPRRRNLTGSDVHALHTPRCDGRGEIR